MQNQLSKYKRRLVWASAPVRTPAKPRRVLCPAKVAAWRKARAS